MNDRDFLVSLQSQIAAQLGTPAIVVTVPPVITPVVAPVITPPPAGVVMLTFSTPSKATLHQFDVGTLYAVKLPKIPAGATKTTRDPATPPNMTVELAYSKTPGDFTWALSDADTFAYAFMPTVKFHPGDAQGNAESASLWWGTVMGQNTCKLDAVGEDWYMNLRVGNASGPLNYWYEQN